MLHAEDATVGIFYYIFCFCRGYSAKSQKMVDNAYGVAKLVGSAPKAYGSMRHNWVSIRDYDRGTCPQYNVKNKRVSMLYRYLWTIHHTLT